MAANDSLTLIPYAPRGTGDGDTEYFESKLWARLAHASDAPSFAASWLDIQCRTFRGVTRGVVILRGSEAAGFDAVATWPENVAGSPELAAVAESAVQHKRVTVQGANRGAPRQDPVFIAHPILVDDELYGVVALEVEARTESALREIVLRLGWGIGWLETLARRNTFSSKAQLVTVIKLVATSLHPHRFRAAAMAVVTELATILGCERVSIGFMKGRHIHLRALSHSAAFGKKSNLIRALESAMDEAGDQLATVVFPPREEGPFQVTRAHAELARQHGTGAVCTIPLTMGETVFGAVVLERPTGEAFDARTVGLCEDAARLVGPVLDVKRKEDRWLAVKAVDSMTTHLRHLMGPRHVALKLWAALAVVVTLFFVFAEGDYQITVDATLEGAVQRAITSALPGYIAETGARAGDVVSKDDMLASIDDRDLRLERLKLVSQRAQQDSEIRQALAEHDRARGRILEAKIVQAQAQIALIDEQLSRTRILAPFNAVVVKGDLSQSLGAPVERGDVLFELAPLDAYRVIMKVDERDITQVTIGQTGQLVLTSMPREKIPVVVEKITPVSVAEEGRNYFRVEASAKGAIEKLRPGMEGVGKIQVARRKLAWIWTHKLVHWARMWIWSWWG